MSAKRNQRSELYINAALFTGIIVFLLLTYPENRAEADDGFWYAALVRDQPIHSLYNPRFLLFLPIIQLMYSLFPSLEAYDFMCFVSIMFAAGALVLLRVILTRYTSLHVSTVYWVVFLILISYEFWRYAFESEVYMVAIFLVTACLYLQLKVFNQGLTTIRLVFLILLSSFTVLVYKPAFLAVFIALPIFFLVRKYYRQLVAFYAVSAFLIIGGYYVTYLLYTLRPDTFIEHLLGGTNEPAGSAMMAPIVVVSNFAATAWIFGVAELKSTVASVFSHKVMQEELMTASQVGWISYLLIFLVLVLSILFLFAVLRAVKYRKQGREGWSTLYSVLTVYILIYGGFLLVMDPSSNEPWLMLSMPIAILAGKLIADPLIRAKQVWLPWTIVLLLFIYNYLGGIGLIQDGDYDYNSVKGRWLTENANKSDLIISLGPMSFVRYIDYYTPSQVVNYEEQFRKGRILLDTLTEFRNNIYLTADMIDPPKAITYRTGISGRKLDSLYTYYGYSVAPVDSVNGLITYKLTRNEY